MRAVRPILFIIATLAAFSASPAAAQSAPSAQDRLWDASMTGDTATIRKAVTDGALVDSLDTRTSRNGRRALNWAAQYNKADAITLLLSLKANIEGVNFTGFTALNHAAENGSIDAVKVLLAAGADPDHANQEGMKPVDVAYARGFGDVAKLIAASAAAPKK